MAPRPCKSAPWMTKLASADIQLHIGGVPFTLNKEVLAAKSSKLSVLLKENPAADFTLVLRDIPADSQTFELVVRFCYGYEINFSAENAVRLCCIAHYLGMTGANNLLDKAITFLEYNVLPNWDKTINALKTTECILLPATQLGLVDACIDSIVMQAQENPHLLGEPTKNLTSDEGSDDIEDAYRPNATRLMVLDWKSEDLTILSPRIYELIIGGMKQRKVPLEYISASLCQYAKKWIFLSTVEGQNASVYKRNTQREVIETIERLLPSERGLLPCSMLFEMLRFAISLDVGPDCRHGIEMRIGKQLDQAVVKDLLIPSQGCAKELQYDAECVMRILKNFFCNCSGLDVSSLIKVAELVEVFLAEVASDIDLKLSTFTSLAELTNAALMGTSRGSDGIYRAIDIYLDKHRYLTQSEREEACRVLDCNKMSREACEHAVQNDRLPMRVVVQVLFVQHLHLRETIRNDRSRKLEEGETRRLLGGNREMQFEMEIGSKVMELESECCKMRKEIQNGGCSRSQKEKASTWKEMKRKFGCVTGLNDCNCHVKKKKVHPK